MHPHALREIADIQDECREVSKKTAVDILVANFPHLSRAFIVRRFGHLMALSPDDLARVLQYQDPTGERAVRNIMDADAARAERELVVA